MSSLVAFFPPRGLVFAFDFLTSLSFFDASTSVVVTSISSLILTFSEVSCFASLLRPFLVVRFRSGAGALSSSVDIFVFAASSSVDTSLSSSEILSETAEVSILRCSVLSFTAKSCSSLLVRGFRLRLLLRFFGLLSSSCFDLSEIDDSASLSISSNISTSDALIAVDDSVLICFSLRGRDEVFNFSIEYSGLTKAVSAFILTNSENRASIFAMWSRFWFTMKFATETGQLTTTSLERPRTPSSSI